MGYIVSKQFLPEEIIEEILFKLPAKSILRFKCVSKQWRSLISSKQFIKHHLAKSLSSSDHHNLIILNSDIHYSFKNRSFKSCSLRSLTENSKITSFNHHPMDHIADRIPMIKAPSEKGYYYYSGFYTGQEFLLGILGSCNGLILITIGKGNLFLWNPTTRQANQIAPPESHAFTDGYPKGYFRYGFGYDEITDDYKVVCFSISYRNRHKTTTSEMYSLRTNSWKKFESFEKGFMFDYSCKFMNGKFVNGKLHWLTDPEEEDHGDWDIVALDLAEEKYEIVGRPQIFSVRKRTFYQHRLHGLGGCLSLTTTCQKSYDMDVWVMTKYGETESWVKFWTFCRTMWDGTILGFACPLWLNIENGNIVVPYPVSTGLDVVVYNGGNVLHRSRVAMLDDPSYFNQEFEAKTYVESLVSPFGDEQEQ